MIAQNECEVNNDFKNLKYQKSEKIEEKTLVIDQPPAPQKQEDAAEPQIEQKQVKKTINFAD